MNILVDFQALNISQKLIETVKKFGISSPTPIQEKTIPFIQQGKDVIAQAQTGTGKTLAFLLPIIDRIDSSTPAVQALIVAPTRELALQITEEARKMTLSFPDRHVLAVYGGQDVEQQLKKLKGANHLVVATPGRLLDHLRRGTIDLSEVSMLVLDEADQMLHMGFLTEVEDVIRHTAPTRQTMLFSATMPAPIRTLAKQYMREPEYILVQEKSIILDEIKQVVIETTDRAKQQTLQTLLDKERPFLAMIFCRTKRRASTLNEALLEKGYLVDELHGDLSQAKREKVMKSFREAKIQFLVATDVAARGLDVEGVTHVFNYDIPHDVESYIHRIGRTGRAGGHGLAFTLVASKDQIHLETIEKGINRTIEKQVIELERATNSEANDNKRSHRRPANRSFNDKKKRVRRNSNRGNTKHSR